MGKGSGRRVENPKLIEKGWARCSTVCAYRPGGRLCIRCGHPAVYGKKSDEHGPTWTDTTSPKFSKPTCRGSYVLGSACGRCERCERERPKPERDDDGRGIDEGGEIIISDYDAYRELQREARIARHLKAILPLVYGQMEKEVTAGF